MKKWLIIIWCAVFVYAVGVISSYWISSNKNKIMYDKIKNNEIAPSNQQYKNTGYMYEKDEKEKEKSVLKKYESLKSSNEELQGWIKISNTRINYPVFRTKDNDFYLKHDAFRNFNSAGSIFMDFRNDGSFKDKNIILYGHNMKDGSMFAELMKYKKEDFLHNNAVIEVNSLYEDIKWQIFSAYVTDTGFDYIKTDFADKEEYEGFLKAIKGKSMFKSQMEVTEKDCILTLSTCSYEFNGARFVVHAKRIL